MMTHALHDPIRHNVWANRQIVAFCKGVEPGVMEQTVPGTYGTVIATLRHIVIAVLACCSKAAARR